MSDTARDLVRAQDALRHGWPITIAGAEGVLQLLPVETGDAAALALLDAGGTPADLIVPAGRATTLKLANQIDAAVPDRPVQIARTAWIDFDAGVAIADPQRDLATPLKGPFRTVPVRHPDAAVAAFVLARAGGILPAFFAVEATVTATAADVSAAAVARLAADPAEGLRIATRARLPVAAAEDAEIVAFRSPASKEEHVALLIGAPNGGPPLTRVHSECLTGDVFGSLKCDCGPQLHRAIAQMRAHGWGLLLYLRQEGRGIGLVNKLRAYALQDQGYDTVDANERLGFAADARDFQVAARMLALLGQTRVRLLTNNPDKVAGLSAAGIDVAERVPLAIAPNPFNARYLATKRDRSGHQL